MNSINIIFLKTEEQKPEEERYAEWLSSKIELCKFFVQKCEKDFEFCNKLGIFSDVVYTAEKTEEDKFFVRAITGLFIEKGYQVIIKPSSKGKNIIVAWGKKCTQ